MVDRSEIMVGSVYEVNIGARDEWRGMCSVSRILDDCHFVVKKLSGLTAFDNEFTVGFKSSFHRAMRLIQLPSNEEIKIKFSFDELLGE